MNKKGKIVRLRNKIWFHIVKPVARLFFFFKYGYRIRNRFHIKKGQPIIVLSNHQADLDPFFVEFAFNTYLYPVASDHMFSTKRDQIQNHIFPAIPKRKGAFDVRCAMMMKKTIEQGGSLLLFPEGNRAYAEFQFPIENSIAKLRSYKTPFVLFNIHGGTGVDPRFAHTKRKGEFYGIVKRVIYPEEYEDMSTEEFMDIIRNDLRVFDSESGAKYKSKKRAEYLERIFFACPKCLNKESLVSEGAYIRCKCCNLKVEYTEDMHLKSDDFAFRFTKTLDWYDFQKDWIRKYEVKDDEIIFSDDNVELTTRNPYEPVEVLAKGKMTITKDSLTVGDKTFLVKEIEVASPLKGNRLLFSIKGRGYHIQGHDRFNPLKYVFMLNKLDSRIKELNVDKMFSLEENKE